MENLDSTVIATSLPAIAMDLHEDPISLKLALTSYLVSLAIFIPASGWAADRFGARKIFRIAILVFTLGSILCGMSATLPGFVGARVVQGLGGAMMVPVGRLVALAFRRTHRTCERALLSDDPGAAWAHHGAAARRLYHHLFSLALDFLDQCADRRRRHRPRDPVRRRRQGRSHLAARRERASFSAALGLPFCLFGLGGAGRGLMPWEAAVLLAGLGASRLDRLCLARAPCRVSADRSQTSFDQNLSRERDGRLVVPDRNWIDSLSCSRSCCKPDSA